MKVKKENKGFALCNFRLYAENETDYNFLPKKRRIPFSNAIYYSWRRQSWFIYKNLELNCDSVYTSFDIIII